MKMSPVTDVGNSETLRGEPEAPAIKEPRKSVEHKLNGVAVAPFSNFTSVLGDSPLLTTTTGNNYLKSTSPCPFPSHKEPMCAFSTLPPPLDLCVRVEMYGCTPPPSFSFMCICLTGGEIRTDCSKDGSQAAACGFNLQDWKMTLFCSNSCCFC